MNGRVFRLDIPVHQAVQELLPWYASAQLATDETRRVHEHLQGCAQCRHALEWEYGMRAEAAARADEMPAGVDMERALARLLPALGPQEHGNMPLPTAPASAANVNAAAGAGASTTVGTAAGAVADATAGTAACAAADGTADAATGARTVAGAGAAPGAAAGMPAAADAEVRRQHGRAPAANQPSWLRWAVAAQWVAIIGLGALVLRPAGDSAAYRTLGAGGAAKGNMVVVFHPDTSERELRRILQAQNARVVDGPTVTDAYLLNVPAATREQALHALRAESAVKLAEPLDGGAP